MNLSDYRAIEKARDELRELPQVRTLSKNQFRSSRDFFIRIKSALSLISLEKEIITFGVFQLLTIAAAYYFWVNMLRWIPNEIWEVAKETDGPSLADLILTIWSFACVGVAAYPLGIFSGCIGAAHFLHRAGKQSTIPACLALVLPKSWSLWLLHWVDGWITVTVILDRLPKKDDKTTAAEKTAREILYYSWKLVTMGLLPALVSGSNFKEAVGQSVRIFKSKSGLMSDFIRLRAGYSGICWIIGIVCYAGSFVLYFWGRGLFLHHGPKNEELYSFYYWMGIPIFVAVGIIQLFLRPIYLISLCEIYSEFLEKEGTPATVPAPSKGTSALVAFFLLVLLLILVALFHKEISFS